MAGARSGLTLRPASAADAPLVAAIYAHHVAHGTATFDIDPPGADFWAAKIVDVQARDWPFIVAGLADEVPGFAYATQIRDRPAYRHTCEDSIYVREGAGGHGIGSALLERLIADAADRGFRQMVAVIGGAEPSSVALHARFGFRHVGRLESVGFKFDRWLDTVYMQRAL